MNQATHDTEAGFDLDLNHLEALARAATPGEWCVKFGTYVMPLDHASRRIGASTDKAEDKAEFAHEICRVFGKYQPDHANAKFIVAAKNAMPALIALARRAAPDSAAQPAQAGEAVDERALFEAKVRELDLPSDALQRWPDGRYIYEPIENNWSGWQWGRASLAPVSAQQGAVPTRYDMDPTGVPEADPNGEWVKFADIAQQGAAEKHNAVECDSALRATQQEGAMSAHQAKKSEGA